MTEAAQEASGEAGISRELTPIFVGRIGTRGAAEVVEIDDLQTVSRPDGSIGLTRRTLAEIALNMNEGSALWIRGSALKNDEFDHPPTELGFVDGRVRLDLESKRVFLNGELSHFAPMDYRLFEYMALRAGKLVERSKLIDEFWGEWYKGRTLDVHVRQIRKNLGDYSWILQTRHHIGYILDDSQDPSQSID